jgi:hypothetical protein
MKKTNLLFLLIVSLFIFSCNSDDDDNNLDKVVTSFKFTFNWDGTPLTINDFNQFNYINEKGDTLSITRMRYLISNITFNKDGESTKISGYNLVDLTDSIGLTYTPLDSIPTENYNSLSFTLGFDEVDNAENYTDLNSVNWNWPNMLGGGYHNMQYEGKFKDSNDDEVVYALHMGKAKVSDGVFQANHLNVTIDGLSLTNNAEIEIKMNIAEWFKNPNIWDLNVFNAPLMPIFEAQIMMNENGASVFSLGDVTQ